MRFTTISLAAIACLVATVQAAPTAQSGPLDGTLSAVDATKGVSGALGGCSNPAPAGPNGYPTVDSS
ncbi:hypothetical protein K492DRAFT_200833, partial [Lichtheimia hyalospora FSU 10163]